MGWFINYYRCPACGQTWVAEWSAQCDDDCPHCGERHISPYKSDDAPIDADVIVSLLVEKVSQSRDRGENIPDWLSDLEDAAIEIGKQENGTSGQAEESSGDQARASRSGKTVDAAKPDPIEALKLARGHLEGHREDFETGLADGTYDDREGYERLCADLASIDAAIAGRP
jgi:hypothetical protein